MHSSGIIMTVSSHKTERIILVYCDSFLTEDDDGICRFYRNMNTAKDNGIGIPTGTEARVCADIARRQQVGIAKYGVTVAENQLSLLEWLSHAYEETLDQAVYLRRAIEQIEREAGDQKDDVAAMWAAARALQN